MKKHIPNALTLVNAFCGCCAIVCILNEDNRTAGLFLIGSLVADFLDGMVARALGVKSEIGKELDSLADMVSFGVVPGVILYHLLTNALKLPYIGSSHLSIYFRATPAFLITCFSCYRLARFNLDTRQTENFIGLATPSNTLFFFGLLMLESSETPFVRTIIDSPWMLYALIPMSCYLMNAEIPMFSFKLNGFKWAGNELRFIFAVLALISPFVLGLASLAFIVILYIILNILFVRPTE
jgi:CDP-diacylglycerol---serine O-phosphatidyltransferase